MLPIRPIGALQPDMRMATILRVLCLALFGSLLSVASTAAQEVVSTDVRAFLDCQQRGCDDDYFRERITYVNWVRDRQDANVHLLITSEGTGGGGTAYTLAFLGRAELEGVEDTFTHDVPGVATQDERRTGLAAVIEAGLVRYLVHVGSAEAIDISAAERNGAEVAAGGEAEPHDDPWNAWVFRIGVNSFLNGESSARFTNLGGNVTASRVTEDWKVDVGFNNTYSEQKFELSSGTSRNITRNTSARTSVVQSVGEHWAVGALASAQRDTRLNQNLTFRFAPAIEYNIYPYAESTRRQLTLQYNLGFNSFDYAEETLFGRVSERHLDQTLAAGIEQTQPWGAVNFTLVGSQFLHDLSKYSVSGAGGVNLRLTRGLDLRINGSYSWIRDQLYLPKRTLDDEEILLRLQQLQTNFRYFTSIGFTYRFGSIFNNVVNPRLRFRGRGGGGGFFF